MPVSTDNSHVDLLEQIRKGRALRKRSEQEGPVKHEDPVKQATIRGDTLMQALELKMMARRRATAPDEADNEAGNEAGNGAQAHEW